MVSADNARKVLLFTIPIFFFFFLFHITLNVQILNADIGRKCRFIRRTFAMLLYKASNFMLRFVPKEDESPPMSLERNGCWRVKKRQSYVKV